MLIETNSDLRNYCKWGKLDFSFKLFFKDSIESVAFFENLELVIICIFLNYHLSLGDILFAGLFNFASKQMDGDMSTDLTKTAEDYSIYKKSYNTNNRRKSKPKNQRGCYDSTSSRSSAYNVVVITTGPNGSAASVEAEEDCLDDNASVCSSQSSGASEHSIGANKKPKKIRRVRCEIHSKKNKKDCSLLEEPEPTDLKTHDVKGDEMDEKQPAPVCTCSKIRARSRRPEPEGGSVCGKGTSGSVIMSELDQILCSNEPLFSDVEEEKESQGGRNEEGEEGQTKQKFSRSVGKRQMGSNVDEQGKHEPGDRIQNRLLGGAGNIESTICLQVLNTNTSIKFAILQTELKNIKDRSLKRVEADINSISAKFSSMQEVLEGCIETLSSFTQQVQQSSKFISAQIEKERREEKELTSSHLDVLDVASKLNFSSCDLDVANDRLSHLERTLTGLENEMRSLGSSNASETVRLKARLKEVLNDLSNTEKGIIHISSCLDSR